MSKILDASCQSGTVQSNGVSVTAQVLSQGTAASEGVVCIEEDKAWYLTSNAEDLESALEEISGALNNISSAISSLAGATGLTLSLTPTILQITAAASALSALKGNLK